MNFLNVILELFFESQARLQGDRLREAGIRAAEKGRRIAIASALLLLAGAFFFSGLLLFLIDLGLQIDRHQGITFSGLMLSAGFLGLIGLLCVFIGWLCGRDPSHATLPPPLVRHENGFRDTLEELATLFLRDFLEQQKAARAKTPPASDTTA